MNRQHYYVIGISLLCIVCCLPRTCQTAMLTIAGDQLNVRSGPGRTYDVIDVVRKNEKFEVLEEKNGWYKISVEGQVGWVSEKGTALIHDRTIDELLKQGDQYFNRQQFTTPIDANAFDLYQEVLRKDPNNAHARKKIDQMAQTYKFWAENAEQRGDSEKAGIFYQRYLFIVPDDQQISNLLNNGQPIELYSDGSLRIVKLRADPVAISRSDLRRMIRKLHFNHPADWSKYSLSSSITGTFRHEYVPRSSEGEPIVLDYATNLMWQQAGSPQPTTWKGAHDYVQQLNSISYAGFSDWRLPTIEELASLLTSEKLNNQLYLAAAFSTGQLWCWSADPAATSQNTMAWYVSFSSGGIQEHEKANSAFVRAVRTVH